MKKFLKKIFLSLSVLICFISIFSFAQAASINLKIYSGDTVLFDSPETVTACAESPEADAPITFNGKCAIEQSGLSNAWSWSDFDGDGKLTDGFLNELDGNSSDYVNNFYWNWYSNLNYGTTSLNSHQLSESEELLLTYNSYPLRISASKTSGMVGDTITLTVEENGFDASFNSVWTPSLEATVTLGTQTCTTIADGTCSIVSDTVGSLNAIGSKILHVPSANLSIEISAPASSGSSSSGGRRNTVNTVTSSTFNVQNALAYLKSAQSPDGSFGGSLLYADWAAIALASQNTTDSSKDTLLAYFNSHNALSSLLTDNERHAMALLAFGQNPYLFNGVNYIKAIINSFDGIQFGDANLVNDDIFALIPLKNSGFIASDDIIIKDIAFLISKQKTDGSWEESVDITAAAIQALKSFEIIMGATESLSKAINYLVNEQSNDGGWNNSVFSTSWVLQGMNTLGASWTKNNKTGIDYFGVRQATDGAVSPLSETLPNRIWATSYAVAASSLKPWSAIMQTVSKPVIITNSNLSLHKKKAILIKSLTPTEKNTLEINPAETTASAINALPTEKTSNATPIVLGIFSGIVLLYLSFNFLLNSRKINWRKR